MSDETSVPATAAPAEVLPPAISQEALTPSSAAKMLASLRNPKKSPAESAAPEVAATAEPELASANSAPETAPAEEPEASEPAETQPPIDPPRSWTQAEKERFQSLPRETQEYLSHREQERETSLRRSQNEIAEQRKAAQAERDAAEKVRKDYEAKLPALQQKLSTVGPFSDIRSMDDLKRLQLEDPFRFQQYQIHIWEEQTHQADLKAAEDRQSQERQRSRAEYVREQDVKLKDLIPEMGDKDKAAELGKKAKSLLADEYGFTESELGSILQSEDGFRLLNDARWQKLIADGVKYAELRKAPPKAAPAKLPPVQRPGVAPARGAANTQNVQNLTQKLNGSGRIEDALAVLQARRKVS